MLRTSDLHPLITCQYLAVLVGVSILQRSVLEQVRSADTRLKLSVCALVPTGSYDATVKAWDLRTRTHEPVQVMGEAKDSITSLQLSSSEILTG